MLDLTVVRTIVFALLVSLGAAAGLNVYVLFLEQSKAIQSRNISETLGLLEQNLRQFDMVAVENVSQVLFRATYVRGLKVVTGSGYVVFDQRKAVEGESKHYDFTEMRDSGDVRHVGSVDIDIVHDPNAIRNTALSSLTGGLLGFLLGRLFLMARSLSRELSVRKASEAALREQEGNLRVLLNSLSEAVIATDSSGRISQMNPVAERLTGWLFGEAHGRPLHEVFRAIDSKTRASVVAQVGAAVAPWRSGGANENVTLVGRHGQEYPISQSLAPMRMDEERMSGVVIVFRDNTAELLAQQRMRDMEKMQAIGVLAGGIAHDFNNLLGVISGAAEIISLKDGPTLTTSSENWLKTIVTTTRRGADLTSRLLAVGHKSTGGHKTFCLHGSIENVVTLLKRTIDKRFDVETHLKATASHVLGDVALIESALLNIGLNASQAMKAEKGMFLITTENVEVGIDDYVVRVHNVRLGPCIRITLRDDGVGIPAENLSRIFEPFFTNRRGGGGFGLGLWAVYNTIRDHGGAIHVESQFGIETTFCIHLPISFEAVASLERRPHALTRKNKAVLVVDDEAELAMTLGEMLASLGCRPRVASGGVEALRIFKDAHATIDAVMVDLNMPEMSGEEVIVEMLKIAPTMPIIISSGYATLTKTSLPKWTRPMLFLKKPYLIADLEGTLRKAFGDECLDV